MSCILGFDFGTKYIGIAIGQTITSSASPLCSIRAQDGIPNWDTIEQLITTWQPDLLVVGLPLNMDGSEQPLTARARKFAQRLHGRFGLPFVLQDERLTTADAKATLFAQGGYKALKKEQIDALSAVFILENYLAQS
ncbi:MAG: Holliday junction resolvase RuvX [Shewanellaceae bacterium]|nr:Holliday junction resolvase RuvX [Shewanellaceae bacterium]